MKITLNPDLDANTLAQDFARKGRLQVRDFFTADTAEETYRQLVAAPWSLAFNHGDQVRELSPQQLQQLSSQQKAELQRLVHENAKHNYQFLYNHYPLFFNYFKKQQERSHLFSMYEFINSPLMLEFFRKLTGREEIMWADGHATLYQAGHFLKYHTDEKPSDKRVAAYVLNFTKAWGRDWGGLLQFWDQSYDVEQAYRPIFNALNIFTVPTDHSVSVVAPFCPGLRFSITGWLRADQPPGAIPQR
ncbi:2OG-Fe(II) oxygenase [Pacificimonas sp. ICDLI1SI03]